jgi:hypothetical protein
MIQITGGSESAPGSLLKIEPNESIRVRLRSDFEGLDFKGLLEGFLHDTTALELRVACQEISFENSRYFVKDRSAVSTSDSVTVRIRQESPI